MTYETPKSFVAVKEIRENIGVFSRMDQVPLHLFGDK